MASSERASISIEDSRQESSRTASTRKDFRYLIFSFSDNISARTKKFVESRRYDTPTDKAVAYKNLLSSCISFIACFGSYVSILSLQSSINSEDGLGLASSAVIYGFFIISALTIAPAVTKLLGSKYALIFGYILLLIYTLLNYYPSWYTLIVGAVINGIGQPHVWISIYKHAQTVALKYAPALKETTGHALFLFSGYVATSVKIAYIFGSLMVSSILFTAEAVEDDDATKNTTNSTSSSSTVCSSTQSPIEPGPIYYVLMSGYTLVGLFGIIVALIFMDHFRTDTAQGTRPNETTPLLLAQSKVPPKKTLQSVTLSILQYMYTNVLLALYKVLTNWKMIMLLPMCLLNGLKLGFIVGIFTQVYIKDCVGIQWIGFAIAVYGAGGSIMAYTTGRIVKYIRQFFLVYSAFVISLSLLAVLIFWERQPSLPLVFCFPLAWVLPESIYNATIPGLIGQWFKEKIKEAAIGIFQVCLSLGFVISFVGGIYLSTTVQLWIMVGFVVLSALTYTILIEVEDKALRAAAKRKNNNSNV